MHLNVLYCQKVDKYFSPTIKLLLLWFGNGSVFIAFPTMQGFLHP